MHDFNSETPYKDKVIDLNIFVRVSCKKVKSSELLQ